MRNKDDLHKQLERHLKDEEFRIIFDELRVKGKIAQKIAQLRKLKGLSQARLAKMVRTKQQSIARFESLKDSRMPSLEFLSRIAKALDKKLVISLEKRD